MVMNTPEATSGRTAQARPRRARRVAAVLMAALTAAGVLSACSSGNSGGRVTLNFYSFQDPSGAVQTAVNECSNSQYQIVYNKLPASADEQRQQLVRRLAAGDTALDILGLDVTWEAEFAEAGWILPWTGSFKQQAENGTLKTSLDTATWRGQLVAVPYNTNTQLLWYRQDLLEKLHKGVPTTWAEMFADSKKLAEMGLPHLIEIQGAQYEGVTVWFNTMVNSAGGSLLNASSTRPGPIAPMVKALEIMHDLATSPAADPSLSVQMEDQNRLAMESGTAAFELNYPFVYPSMVADNPTVKTYNGKSLAKNFKWAKYPSVIPGKPARVTIGGIDLAISKYSPHPQLAFKAALCLRNRPHQLLAAIKGGLPPTLVSIYQNPPPAFVKAYPFYKEVFSSLQNASVRPKTPAYQNVSIVVSHSVSPPSSINPQGTANTIQSQMFDALASKGLVP